MAESSGVSVLTFPSAVAAAPATPCAQAQAPDLVNQNNNSRSASSSAVLSDIHQEEAEFSPKSRKNLKEISDPAAVRSSDSLKKVSARKSNLTVHPGPHNLNLRGPSRNIAPPPHVLSAADNAVISSRLARRVQKADYLGEYYFTIFGAVRHLFWTARWYDEEITEMVHLTGAGQVAGDPLDTGLTGLLG